MHPIWYSPQTQPRSFVSLWCTGLPLCCKCGVGYFWKRAYVTSWPTKLKIFTTRSFIEKCANLLYIYKVIWDPLWIELHLSHQYLLKSFPLSHSMLQPSHTTWWRLLAPSSLRGLLWCLFSSLETSLFPISGKTLCWLQETTEMTPPSLRKKLNSVILWTKQYTNRTNFIPGFKWCPQVSFSPLLSSSSSVFAPDAEGFQKLRQP